MLINDFRNIAVLSTMDQIVRITIVELATKDIKLFEYVNFTPIGMHAPPQFPTSIILYTQKEVYLTDIENGLKIHTLNLKKFL